MAQTPDSTMALRGGPVAVPNVSPKAGDAKLKAAAKHFEAMFMTEMIRAAKPPSHAAGRFATGNAEKTWQVFLDQALGDAAVAHGGTGLAGEIEKELQAAQRQGTNGVKK